MNPEKPTLDGLRIERRSDAARAQPSRMLPALLAFDILGAVFFWWQNRAQPVPVQTVVARAQAAGGASKTLLNASGYVTARRAATVSSKVTGKVTEVLVEEGKKVAEGEVLARLDASNVEASMRLAQAQAQAARSSLEETKPNLAFAQRELKRFTVSSPRGAVRCGLAEPTVIAEGSLPGALMVP